ncbi:MAG: DUF4214 domain-containing protein [Lachnospiraceae bacterium]|nr:DUF4214 domain-containing protein [Lachnospiraceae bacterium]
MKRNGLRQWQRRLAVGAGIFALAVGGITVPARAAQMDLMEVTKSAEVYVQANMDGGTTATDTLVIIKPNVTVKNCTCERILVTGSANGFTLEGNTVSDGIYVDPAITSGSIVKNNVTSSTRAGIDLDGASGVTVEDNKVHDITLGNGISLKNTSNCQIIHNEITKVGSVGIIADGDTGTLIKGNLVKEAGMSDKAVLPHGIIVYGCTGVTLQQNNVDTVYHANGKANDGDGIIVSAQSANTVVKENHVLNTANHGIQIYEGATNTQVIDNYVANAAGEGITVAKGAQDTLISGNGVEGASVGIAIQGTQQTIQRATIKNNSVNEAASYGINVTGAIIAELNDNRILSPGGIGLFIHESTVEKANDNTIANTGAYGWSMSGAIVKEASGNELYRDTRSNDATETHNGIGIQVLSGSELHLSDTVIQEYGAVAIMNIDSKVYARNVQALVTGMETFSESYEKNAFYHNAENFGDLGNFRLVDVNIGLTEAGAVATVDGAVPASAGAVTRNADGTFELRPGTVSERAEVAVTYPNTATDEVALFVRDTNGNTVVLNAYPNFDMSQATSRSEEERRAMVEAFVSRMYTCILDREVEAGGLAFWSGLILDGTSTAADCAKFFVLESDEFLNANLNNDVFLDRLYPAFFGDGRSRLVDPEGYAFWTQMLEMGYSRKWVLAGFAGSQEFSNICATYGIPRGEITLTAADNETSDANLYVDRTKVEAYVTRLYNQILHRAAEADGVKFWSDAIVARQVTAYEVATEGFFKVPEYVNADKSIDDFLTDCYHALMDREPEADGIAFWKQCMANGMTREQVVQGFGNSPEFTGILQSYGLIRK